MKYIYLFFICYFAAFDVSAVVKGKVGNVGCDYKNDDLYKPEWTAGDNHITNEEFILNILHKQKEIMDDLVKSGAEKRVEKINIPNVNDYMIEITNINNDGKFSFYKSSRIENGIWLASEEKLLGYCFEISIDSKFFKKIIDSDYINSSFESENDIFYIVDGPGDTYLKILYKSKKVDSVYFYASFD